MKSTNFKSLALVAFAVLGFAGPAHAVEVAFERDSNLPIVYLNVALKTGAIADPRDASGLTDFMGEMLLRGTRSRTKEQIDVALDQMGANLAIEVRAEATILRGAVLSSQLDPFLDLVAEIVTQPAFPEREIGKLRTEMQSKLLEEQGSDQQLVGREFTKFLFHGHPYGNPVQGTIHGLEKITRARVLDQYGRLVIDPLLLVVGTGDAPSEKISSWADSVAAKLPQTGLAEVLQKVAAPEELPFKRLLIVDKPDRTQTQITGGQIGVRMTDPDFFPLYLGNHAFGGGSFSARMMVQIRVKRGWSYGAYSYFKHGREPRSWQFYLFPASKDTPPALALSVDLVNQLGQTGVTPEEFEFAKTSLINSSGFMFNTAKKRVENKLLERTLDLPDGFMKTYGPELAKVSIDQVNGAMKKFIHADHLAITVVGTAKDLKDQLIKSSGVSPEHVQVVPWNSQD